VKQRKTSNGAVATVASKDGRGIDGIEVANNNERWKFGEAIGDEMAEEDSDVGEARGVGQ